MKFVENPFVVKPLAILLTIGMVSLTAPSSAFAPDRRNTVPQTPAKQPPKSCVLSEKEMETRSGSKGENPYFAGTNHYSQVVDGVDLMTGNFATSSTDLDFKGGYGIPIAATRSYSANTQDEGPFGKGWVLSMDIRTTAGGVLKSAKSQSLTVPIRVRQMPIGEAGPDTSSGVEGQLAMDSTGHEDLDKFDVDGYPSTPPWDQNDITPSYETETVNGNDYQVLSGETIVTPDGTTYTYAKMGAYDTSSTNNGATGDNLDGVRSYTPPPSIPSNILKIQSIVDRNGNETDFSYDVINTSKVWYYSANGVTWEHPLVNVTMPGGRQLNVTWTTLASTGGPNGNTIRRVTQIDDGTTTRKVLYAYDSANQLHTVTTPGGLITTYGYDVAGASEDWIDTYGTEYVSDRLLTSITDPRGMTTTMDYWMSLLLVPTTESWKEPGYGTDPVMMGVACYRIKHPNGINFYYGAFGFSPGPSDMDYPTMGEDYARSVFNVRVGNRDGELLTGGNIKTDLPAGFTYLGSSNAPVYTLEMDFSFAKDVNTGSTPPPVWRKTYLLTTGDMIQELHATYPTQKTESGDLHLQRGFPSLDGESAQTVQSDNVYNFLGNILQQTVTESTSSTAKVTKTAYWDKAKYWQKKATQDPAGRLTFTDYFDTSATAGLRGQVYRVFDPKYANWGGTTWDPDAITPTDGNLWSAQFDYDAYGRPTDAKKLQSVGTIGSSSTYARVDTVTTYGGSGSPYWGAASSVTEDNGGPAQRTSYTDSYDSAGNALTTRDAAGKSWLTTYDYDEKVQSVACDSAGGSSYTDVLDYFYGTSGLNNGLPTEVDDKSDSGRTIVDTITYVPSTLNGYGQVASTSESQVYGGSSHPIYTNSYTYNSASQRETVNYTTLNGKRQWRYADYVHVGDPLSATQAYQTLIKQSSSDGGLTWADTEEQMHYTFDAGGRLRYASFGQTKNSTYDGYIASNRATAAYLYDAAGRTSHVLHTWDTLSDVDINNIPTFTTDPIPNAGFSYDYDVTTGLKTDSVFKTASGGTWVTDHTESYGYDSQLDYLTSANYGDGSGSHTWGYDAAGNRTSTSEVSGTWTYNDLNEMTASPNITGFSGGSASVGYTYDQLGNRSTRNQISGGDIKAAAYTWDKLNRMTKIGNHSNGYAASYRADGQRIEKKSGYYFLWFGTGSSSGFYTWGGSAMHTFTYCYDGQMGSEDDDSWTVGSTAHKTINDYGLGARGIDYMEYTDTNNSSNNSVGYPLYDGHGNMVMTLAKSGSSYSTSNQRSYDAWGLIRSGATSGLPNQRYCAKLGHTVDDETGLIYMRARYYEPVSGRFVNEDCSAQGRNWYVYASNEPLGNVDFTGKAAWWYGPDDIFGLMENLYSLFCGTQQWGYGTAYRVEILKTAQNFLRRYVAEAKAEGMASISEAESEETAALWWGPEGAEFGTEMAEAKQAVGARQMALSVVAQIFIHVIDLMIMQLQNGPVPSFLYDD